jgi:hypothetical protein
MPGMFTPHKGSSLPTSTVWFGGVADRLNMLRRWDGSIFGNNAVVTSTLSGSAANFANQAFLNAVTLGAFTTAPDGTTNSAQLIAEDNSNGQHQLNLSNYFYLLRPSCRPSGTLRLAGYWKPGPTARRLIYEIRSYAPFGYVGDVYGYVIFDLANGQIGVAPTLVNSQPSLNPLEMNMSASISPAPDGFFLCTLDYSLNVYLTDFPGINLLLDNGTGTAARSDSYTGTTGGIYGWRINQMPVGAYGINKTVFLDDFTSLSTIDVNNTKVAINPATGQPYNWFVDANMNEWTLTTHVASPASYHIDTPSILTLTPDNPPATNINMTSWTNAGIANAGIGQGWRMPLLVEINMAIDVNAAPLGGPLHPGLGGWAFWGDTIEWFRPGGGVGGNYGAPTLFPSPSVNLLEVDFLEVGAGGGSEDFVPHVGFPLWAPYTPGVFPTDNSFIGGNTDSLTGTGLYQAQNPYRSGGGSTVMNNVDGIKYQQNGTTTPAGNPPPNATYWTPLAAPPPPTRGQPAIPQNLSQFNTWSTLLLPWHGSPGAPSGLQMAGICMQFFNGCYVGPGITWSPFTAIFGKNTSGPQTAEGQQRILFVAGDIQAGVPLHIDWIRVMQ